MLITSTPHVTNPFTYFGASVNLFSPTPTGASAVPVSVNTPVSKPSNTPTNGFGPTQPVANISPPVAPAPQTPMQPVPNFTVSGNAGAGSAQGVANGFDARKFLEENKKEITQILVVGALIWVGFHYLDK